MFQTAKKKVERKQEEVALNEIINKLMDKNELEVLSIDAEIPTKINIRDYKTALKKLPSNRNKRRAYKGKSIHELIKLRTINKNLTKVTSLFNMVCATRVLRPQRCRRDDYQGKKQSE